MGAWAAAPPEKGFGQGGLSCTGLPLAHTGQPRGLLRELPSSLVPRQASGGSACVSVPRPLGVGAGHDRLPGQSCGFCSVLELIPKGRPRVPLAPRSAAWWPGQRWAGRELAPARRCRLSSQRPALPLPPCTPLTASFPLRERGLSQPAERTLPLMSIPAWPGMKVGPALPPAAENWTLGAPSPGGQRLGSGTSDSASESS